MPDRVTQPLIAEMEMGNFTDAGVEACTGNRFWLFDYRKTGDPVGDRSRGGLLVQHKNGTFASNQFGYDEVFDHYRRYYTEQDALAARQEAPVGQAV